MQDGEDLDFSAATTFCPTASGHELEDEGKDPNLEKKHEPKEKDFVGIIALLDIKGILVDNFVDYSKWGDTNQRINDRFEDLQNQLQDGRLILSKFEGALNLVGDSLVVQIVARIGAGNYVLTNSHVRAENCSARLVTSHSPCTRHMAMTREQAVQTWMAELLQVPFDTLSHKFALEELHVCRHPMPLVEPFPGLPSVVRTLVVQAKFSCELGELALDVPPGRPLVLARKADGAQCLWSWLPASLRPGPETLVPAAPGPPASELAASVDGPSVFFEARSEVSDMQRGAQPQNILNLVEGALYAALGLTPPATPAPSMTLLQQTKSVRGEMPVEGGKGSSLQGSPGRRKSKKIAADLDMQAEMSGAADLEAQASAEEPQHETLPSLPSPARSPGKPPEELHGTPQVQPNVRHRGPVVLRAAASGPSAVVAYASLAPAETESGFPWHHVVLHVDLEVDPELFFDREIAYKGLMQADGDRTARLLYLQPWQEPYGKMFIWQFALERACWSVPEYQHVALSTTLIANLEEVVRLACCSRGFSNVPPSMPGQPLLNCLGVPPTAVALDLLPRLPRLMTEITGSGGFFFRLMKDNTHRDNKDIMRIYAIDELIQAMSPNNKEKDKLNQSPFMGRTHAALLKMGLTTRELGGSATGNTPTSKSPKKKASSGRLDEDFEDLAALVEATMDKLNQLKKLSQDIQADRFATQRLWRPISCTSHGEPICASFVADVLGSVWCCGASALGGSRPVFWDVASFSISLLLESCRTPVSIAELCLIATESWLSQSELSKWLSVSQSVAKEMLEKARDPGFHASLQGQKEQFSLVKLMQCSVPFQQEDAQLVIRQLKAQLLARRKSAVEARQLSWEFLEIWLESVRLAKPFPAKIPTQLPPEMVHAWELQHLALTGVQEAYQKHLAELKAKQEPVQEIDKSDALLLLPLLYHLLLNMKSPVYPPWEKVLMTRLCGKLTDRLLDALSAVQQGDEAGEQEAMAAMASCMSGVEAPALPQRPKNGARIVEVTVPTAVSFAAGQRIAVWSPLHPLDPYGAAVGAARLDSKGGASGGRASPAAALLRASAGTPGGRASPAPGGRASPADSGPSALPGVVALLRVISGSRKDAVCNGTLQPPVPAQQVLLDSWPCPPPGITLAQMWSLLAAFGRTPEALAASGALAAATAAAADGAEGKRAFKDALLFARQQVWEGLEAEALYEVYDVAGMTDEVLTKALGPELLLKECLQVEDLNVLGQCVGVVARGKPRTRPCTSLSGVEHKDVRRKTPDEAFARFGCSACTSTIKAPKNDPREANFVHCPFCWRDENRFDLCMRCAGREAPTCNGLHHMETCQISPYDATPVCYCCQGDIPSLPPWDHPEPPPDQDCASADEVVYFFHCHECRVKGLPPRDACRRCARVRCPLGHPMVRIDRCEEATAQQEPAICENCSQIGNNLFRWQCVVCQAAAFKVEYPSKQHAMRDLGLSLSHTKGRGAAKAITTVPGITVPSVIGGGPAQAAGVRAGCRIVAINGRKAMQNTLAAAKDGPVTLDFGGQQVDVKYESNAQIQQDIIWRYVDNDLFVTSVDATGSAAVAGVGKGWRLATVNNVPAEDLHWNGRRSIDEVVSASHIYCLHFEKPGYVSIMHPTCGILCDRGHAMLPQYPGFLVCRKGHTMCPTSIKRLDSLADRLHCTKCRSPFSRGAAEDSRCFMCFECTAEVLAPALEPDLDEMKNYATRGSQLGALESLGEPAVVYARTSIIPGTSPRGGARPSVATSVPSPPAAAPASPWGGARPSAATPAPTTPVATPARGIARKTAPSVKRSSSSKRSSQATQDDALKRKLLRQQLIDTPRGTAALAGAEEKYIANRSMLCCECATRLAHSHRSPPPYLRMGRVDCKECSAADLAGTESEHLRRSPSQDALPKGPFFHCPHCWEDEGVRYDVCGTCSRDRLRCRSESRHKMISMAVTPYAGPLNCNCCDEYLPPDEEAYICMDCWKEHGTRSARCARCATQQSIYFVLDKTARFKLLSGESTAVSWASPMAPEFSFQMPGGLGDNSIELVVRLRVCGFAYPSGTRLRIFDQDEVPRDATVVGLVRAGKYEVRMDRSDEVVLLEPRVGNHAPCGVWRYGLGQKLNVFCEERGWLDVRVCEVAEPRAGNRHLVLRLNAKGEEPFSIDLNSWNHSPMWLPAEQWAQEQNLWETHLLVQCQSVDLLTGIPVDIMSRVWNVIAVNTSPDNGRGGARDVFGEVLPWLLASTSRSLHRDKGVHDTRCAWIVGEACEGKTLLLKRLVVECIKAHGGEMVPLLISGRQLAATCKNSQVAAGLLEHGELLEEYLRCAYGTQLKRYRFLRQALQQRRLLVLLDGFDALPQCQRESYFRAVVQVALLGHRIIVTSRPNALPEAAAAKPWPAALARLTLSPLTEEQRWWLATERLGEARGEELLGRLAGLRAPGDATSSAPMFEFVLRFAETLGEQSEDQLRPPSQLAVQPTRSGPKVGQTGRPGARQDRKAAGRQTDSGRGSGELTPRLPPVGSKAPTPEPQRPTTADTLQLGRRSPASPSPTSVHGSRAGTPASMAACLADAVTIQPPPPLPETLAAYLYASTLAACRWIVEPSPEERRAPEAPEAKEQQAAADAAALVAHQILCVVAEHMQSKGLEEIAGSDVLGVLSSEPAWCKMWRRISRPIKNGKCFLITCQHEEDAVEGQRSTAMRQADSRSTAMDDQTGAEHGLGAAAVYRFVHSLVQHYFAARHIHATWGQFQCPVYDTEGMIASECLQPVMPYFAELRTAPIKVVLGSLSDAQAQALGEMLVRTTCIKELSFERAGIGQFYGSFLLFCSALEQNGSLEILDLTENGLGSKGVEKLSSALQVHKALRELHLAGNHIGCTGATHVSAMLKTNKGISTLDLAENSIGNQGLLALLEGMKLNRALLTVNLRRNRIGPECEEKIAAALDAMDLGARDRVLDTGDNRRGLPGKFSTHKSTRTSQRTSQTPLPPVTPTGSTRGPSPAPSSRGLAPSR